ncbi:MAG: hypothetical protein DI628_06630 [Blastochloris viridis]|uniref:Uncharacterized protein n=1 Tax=Blastochloris viridis TaxID=1079 RepID=A0A6N4R4A5_BLAVI|nr:MAG: hypothetical protein DI628_06630 [Blastochloris viridis]
MGVFYSATQAEGTPQHMAANLAFSIATLLAGVSLLLTLLSGTSQPVPLMLACMIILLGLWKPMWFAPLTRLWYDILNALTRMLLTLYWLLYIVPSGLYMQLRGHDPLQRQFNPKAITYWQEPQPATDMRKLG